MLYGLLFKWESHLHDIERYAYIWKVYGIYLGKILNSEKSSDVSVVTLPAQKKTTPYVVVKVYANIV